MIRAIPTTSSDRIYCKVLGQTAVHAAFAGGYEHHIVIAFMLLQSSSQLSL